MDDEYLTRCVVDPIKRKLYLYSSEGDEKIDDIAVVLRRKIDWEPIFSQIDEYL